MRYVSLAEQSGYGEAARAYLRGLWQAGRPLTWTPLIWQPHGYEPLRNRISLAAQRYFTPVQDDPLDIRRLIYHRLAYDTVIIHTVPELWPRFLKKDVLTVGMTVWETTMIPPHWRALLQLPDRLLAPSEFTRQVLLHNGVTTPVTVIPHICAAAQRERTPDEIREFCQNYHIPAERFVFYSINAWTARKAVWHTLRAYLQAFTRHDPVVLIIKTSRSGPRDEQAAARTATDRLVREIQAEFPEPAQVCCLNHALTPHEMQCLHQIGDCYVSLTHAEGWGLGAFDAAARGKPVIMTGWGGHLDYLTPDTAFFVDYTLIPVQDYFGRESYQPNQQWAQPDLEAAVAWLRHVYAQPQQARQKAASLPAALNARFQEAVVTQTLLAAITT